MVLQSYAAPTTLTSFKRNNFINITLSYFSCKDHIDPEETWDLCPYLLFEADRQFPLWEENESVISIWAQRVGPDCPDIFRSWGINLPSLCCLKPNRQYTPQGDCSWLPDLLKPSTNILESLQEGGAEAEAPDQAAKRYAGPVWLQRLRGPRSGRDPGRRPGWTAGWYCWNH